MDPDAAVEALEIRLLLEAIYDRYGYDLRDYAAPSMRRRVLGALAKSGACNLGDLQHKILSDADFFTTVLDVLTVRVTEMFRDPAFYRAFRARVVPILRTYPLLKIWHSGCASGEEVYASAILLSEEGLYDRSQIYTTDVSYNALEQAKQGVYADKHLESFAENYKSSGGTSAFSNYYTAAYDHFAMRESLRRNILFFQHDLVSDHAFGEMNVIFCRNVLIYFGKDLRDRVLHKFARSLCPGGLLCLGSSEQLSPSNTKEPFAEFAPQERIYRYQE